MNIIDLHKISSQHILFDIRSILGKNTMVYTEIASKHTPTHIHLPIPPSALPAPKTDYSYIFVCPELFPFFFFGCCCCCC